MNSTLIQRDLQAIWHPCSQMKDYETFLPLEISRAKGAYLELTNGKKIIDAISSWWCKSLGHGHPRLQAALLRQMSHFEHVILANTTYEGVVELSEQLINLSPSLQKVFYASDGACAIEIALKMSIHARQIKGETGRNKLLALENSYHGETLGALSVSDTPLYKKPYTSFLLDVAFLRNLPYVATMEDPLWQNCETYWPHIEQQLNHYAQTATAIIIEPIVQGAGGMLIYSQDLLKRLRRWATENNVHLIADEIMTGFGRTGKMLACDYAGIEPDFVCLGKGLTAGWLPLSAVLTNNDIYQLFYDDYATGKAFLHSHTFSGNALAVSVANEVLKVYKEEAICKNVTVLGKQMLQLMHQVAHATGKLVNVRGIGGIVAADLLCGNNSSRAGFEVFKVALKYGALLRPLGNTIYWLPPLNTELATLQELKHITQQALLQASF